LARPAVGVYTDSETKGEKRQTVKLPAVFTTPIRPDLVSKVFSLVACNRKQAYAVSRYAGHQHSAESWGTGRAVARIPRISGGGTSRAGQGAFGNMCRGGRMFAPTRVWRRWHRKSNLGARRFANASAVSATAIPALVMARGHRIEKLNEVPVVVDTKVIEKVTTTKGAVALLKNLGAYDDVLKAKDSITIRAGKGKWRNRRWRMRRGPLVVYDEANAAFVKAFRNLSGVDSCAVSRLNLLKLAPGGHLGRFVIWTRDAFQKLDAVYGTTKTNSTHKKGFRIPRPMMANPNLSRLLQSDEIQNVLRPKQKIVKAVRKVNPLTHPRVMEALNPGSLNRRRQTILAAKKRAEDRAAVVKTGKKYVSKESQHRRKASKVLNKKLAKSRKAFKTALHSHKI